MSLYEITKDLQEITAILEEQGGEFTEEQLEFLECTQENFRDKLKDYYNCIKYIKNDVLQCKEEENRIKLIRKSKENTANKLENLVLDAVKQFGTAQKNGVISIEYPTFKLSTRKSIGITLDETRIETFIRLIRNYLEELDVMCCLDQKIDVEGMIGAINAIYKSEWENNHDSGEEVFTPFTIDDFNVLEVKFESTFPIGLLINDSEYKSLCKAIVDNPNTWLVNATGKDSIKDAINNGQNITIGYKVGNLSLQMK